jgi:hypothetical protein
MAIQLRSNNESVRGQYRLDGVDNFKNKAGAVFETSPVLKAYVRW